MAPETTAGWRSRLVGEERVDPKTLLAHPLNFRKHPEAQARALEAVIEEIGIIDRVILAADDTIIDGHLRWELALSRDEPALDVQRTDLSPEEAAIALQTFDPIGGMATHDVPKLRELLAAAKPAHEALRAMAEATLRAAVLDAAKRRAAANRAHAVDLAGEDDARRGPPEHPITVPGDLIIMGEHRLLCGDATDTAAVQRLLGGETVGMVYTDPPYNADYSSRVDAAYRRPWGGILNDKMPQAQFGEFITDVCATIWTVAPEGASVYLWCDWKHVHQVSPLFSEAFTHKAMIVWDKTQFGLGTYYRTQYEILLFGTRGEKVATWNAAHDERDVWSLPRDAKSEYLHPTQKPTGLAERAIANSSEPGAVVLDLFGGSGSTLIGAHKAGRRAYLMELDPRYCDVIVNRWQQATGQTAVRPGTSDDEETAA